MLIYVSMCVCIYVCMCVHVCLCVWLYDWYINRGMHFHIKSLRLYEKVSECRIRIAMRPSIKFIECFIFQNRPLIKIRLNSLKNNSVNKKLLSSWLVKLTLPLLLLLMTLMYLMRMLILFSFMADPHSYGWFGAFKKISLSCHEISDFRSDSSRWIFLRDSGMRPTSNRTWILRPFRCQNMDVNSLGYRHQALQA